MVVTATNTVYGWIRDILTATEYKTTKYENGSTKIDVIVRPIAVDTYDRYGHIKAPSESLFDVKV